MNIDAKPCSNVKELIELALLAEPDTPISIQTNDSTLPGAYVYMAGKFCIIAPESKPCTSEQFAKKLHNAAKSIGTKRGMKAPVMYDHPMLPVMSTLVGRTRRTIAASIEDGTLKIASAMLE